MDPEKHLVRVINEMIEKMQLEAIESGYKGGGTSSYHPRMLLKLIVYAYAEKNYSGRQIAKLVRLRENAFNKLTREIGEKLRRRRLAEVEAVFGLLKENGLFRRFHLRGLEKVEVEWGILSMAHNIKKLAAI